MSLRISLQTFRPLHVLWSTGALWLVWGCLVTRPLPVAIDASSVASHLAEHPAVNLQVTEQSGKRYRVHAPKILGDSLIGRRGYDVPARPAGVHLQDVIELRTGHFSPGRTAAALGGALLVTGVTLAILVENAEPIY
jgi:hypothetical protein